MQRQSIQILKDHKNLKLLIILANNWKELFQIKLICFILVCNVPVAPTLSFFGSNI